MNEMNSKKIVDNALSDRDPGLHLINSIKSFTQKASENDLEREILSLWLNIRNRIAQSRYEIVLGIYREKENLDPDLLNMDYPSLELEESEKINQFLYKKFAEERALLEIISEKQYIS